MTLLDFLQPQYKGTGAVTPNLKPEDAVKNYRLDEIVATAQGINFSETRPELWKTHPRRDQAQSGTCVAQTIAKMAGIMREMKTGEYVEYSATPIYQNRVNKPQAGMIGVDALDLWRKQGVTLEHLVPSQSLSDAQVEAQTVNQYEKEIGAISKLDAYVTLPTRSFNLLVSTLIATQKPIMVWFWGEYDEWSRDIPQLLHGDKSVSTATVRHSVTATPNIGIYNGKQGFTIEDSWGSVGIGGQGIRFITREMYEARNFFAAYPTNFKTYKEMGVDPAKPKHHFTRNLSYGLRGDQDVIALQTILKYEDLFPANVDSTGNYYEITRKGVLNFQLKHGIPTDGLEGTLVGVKTRRALNDMYA